MKTIFDFYQMKKEGKKISMVTCYESWSAKLLSKSEIDMLLVGDSLAMVVHGHESTIPATMQQMIAHTEAVARSAKGKFIVGDMPFISYRTGLKDAVENAGQLLRSGAQAVKLEGAAGNLETITHLVQSGIPVMGHLGLTPQSVYQLGGFKVQARDPEAQAQLLKDSKALEAAGCFSLVLECVPAAAAATVAQELKIPVIGIGAGLDVDGQVLVLHDLLGLSEGFKPKFLREFGQGADFFNTAINSYVSAVRDRNFPSRKESYE